MTEQMNTLLDVRHLSVSFESYDAKLQKVIFTAVKDMSLTLEKGKILAIVGSSGSGKSLLAHAVMGILPDNAKTGGTFYYKGEKLTKKKIEEIRGKKMAFIPQSISFLDPLMPVGEQVQGIQGKAVRELQEKLFKHFHLKEGTDKLYPFQLSGGMARRILLSTALVGNSELIIADEPTPGLDWIQRLKHYRIFAVSPMKAEASFSSPTISTLRSISPTLSPYSTMDASLKPPTQALSQETARD